MSRSFLVLVAKMNLLSALYQSFSLFFHVAASLPLLSPLPKSFDTIAVPILLNIPDYLLSDAFMSPFCLLQRTAIRWLLSTFTCLAALGGDGFLCWALLATLRLTWLGELAILRDADLRLFWLKLQLSLLESSSESRSRSRKPFLTFCPWSFLYSGFLLDYLKSTKS